MRSRKSSTVSPTTPASRNRLGTLASLITPSSEVPASVPRNNTPTPSAYNGSIGPTRGSCTTRPPSLPPAARTTATSPARVSGPPRHPAATNPTSATTSTTSASSPTPPAPTRGAAPRPPRLPRLGTSRPPRRHPSLALPPRLRPRTPADLDCSARFARPRRGPPASLVRAWAAAASARAAFRASAFRPAAGRPPHGRPSGPRPAPPLARGLDAGRFPGLGLLGPRLLCLRPARLGLGRRLLVLLGPSRLPGRCLGPPQLGQPCSLPSAQHPCGSPCGPLPGGTSSRRDLDAWLPSPAGSRYAPSASARPFAARSLRASSRLHRPGLPRRGPSRPALLRPSRLRLAGLVASDPSGLGTRGSTSLCLGRPRLARLRTGRAADRSLGCARLASLALAARRSLDLATLAARASARATRRASALAAPPARPPPEPPAEPRLRLSSPDAPLPGRLAAPRPVPSSPGGTSRARPSVPPPAALASRAPPARPCGRRLAPRDSARATWRASAWAALAWWDAPRAALRDSARAALLV